MDTELQRLLDKVNALPPMTADEIAAQRKGYCVAEMMFDHPEMTREEVEDLYDRVALMKEPS